MMATHGAQLAFTSEQAAYFPGDELTGTYFIGPCDLEDVKSVELSVLWHTEGKGDEDMAVHHFQRLEPASPEWRELARPLPFRTRLPNSPLSYDGVILKIRWCVRMRVFMRRARDIIEELSFQLGNVPAAATVTEAVAS
jgi:hypothetical protein